MSNYIVKETKPDGSILYHTSGHSTLSKGITKISKYYTYESTRGAKMLASKLTKQNTIPGKTFEVVSCEEEGIEVKWIKRK